MVGTGLLMVGLGFKSGHVPFHMWTPDAYQGAPSPVTGFMAAATKIAAFAAILRLFDAALFPLRDDWRPLLIGARGRDDDRRLGACGRAGGPEANTCLLLDSSRGLRAHRRRGGKRSRHLGLALLPRDLWTDRARRLRVGVAGRGHGTSRTFGCPTSAVFSIVRRCWRER